VLFEFLAQHKKEIIQLCKDKVLAAGESKTTSELLDRGIPAFYDKLVEILQRKSNSATGAGETRPGDLGKPDDAVDHGRESLRLGYTIGQVVHAYGAVCQSITEFAQSQSCEITTQEFQGLNLSLDYSIANAVTEFNKIETENANLGEIERLGFFAHELGNSLAAASLAFSLIQKGQVGLTGATSEVLKAAFERMRYVISHSMAEVRLRGHFEIEKVSVRLADVLSEVEAISNIMGLAKRIRLIVGIVGPEIVLTADRHLLFAALSNLVSNAIKFTKQGGQISVWGKESGERVLIEVEDECGGLPTGNAEEIFKSFVQKGIDKTGMGLGLSISRRAVELNRGKLSVRDVPGQGCVFTIDLPKGEAKSV
jgi:hypothetical protein